MKFVAFRQFQPTNPKLCERKNDFKALFIKENNKKGWNDPTWTYHGM